MPFEGARVHRERITRTDIEAFGTTARCPGCNAIRAGKRAQAHSDPRRLRIEECLKTTPEDSERWNRRSEVLHEALAKEFERNVRRREEIGSTTGVERHVLSIPPDSDPRKRRIMKAASTGRSQMDSSPAVAHESRMDAEGKVRKHKTLGDEFRRNF